MSLGLFRMNPNKRLNGAEVVSQKTHNVGGGYWSGMGPADKGTYVRETIVNIGPHQYSIKEEHWSENYGPNAGRTLATVIWPSSAPAEYAGRQHWQTLVEKQGTGEEVRAAVIEELKTAPGRLHKIY